MRAYNEKNYDEAIVDFTNALNYKPDSYSALCLLGTSYAYKKDSKMAEKTFQDAVKLFPNEWNAYIFLGDLKRSQHDYEVAIDYYETAVTLESMGGKEKIYYKKLLKEIKDEEAAFNVKEKIIEEQNTPVTNTQTSTEQTGDVNLSIDNKKWTKVLDQGDEKTKIVEYGLIGEDIKNLKWSQLITVQYFVLNDNYKPEIEEYYKNHIGSIEAIAKNSNKSFEKKIITQRKNDMLYEWKFDNSKETELARIIHTPKGIYHIHIAKKGAFSNNEKVKYIDMLKTAV